MIKLYVTLSAMSPDWAEQRYTSKELGLLNGSSPELIRKDLNTLGCSAGGRGYIGKNLAGKLKERLKIQSSIKAGLAGLDDWGSILIKNRNFIPAVKIAAAFDSSQNRLERCETDIALFPNYEIPEVFRDFRIELGILASDTGRPELTASRMIEGGARGILNLTSSSITVPEGIIYQQMDLKAGVFSIISRMNGSK